MATTLPRALPHLDERQTAMLAEMGIAPWWAPRALLPQPRVATAAAERAPEPPVLPRPPAATPATPPAVPPTSPNRPTVAPPPMATAAPVLPEETSASHSLLRNKFVATTIEASFFVFTAIAGCSCMPMTCVAFFMVK